jgi:peptide/nickel transport system substrate-binding protein
MRKRWFTSLVLVGMMVATVAACGDDDDDAASGSPSTAAGATSASTSGSVDAGAPCPAGDADKTLTMGIFSETSGLDPIVSNGSGATGGTELTAIYDTLTRWNPDTQKYEPQVAESLEPNADFTQWTMKLRAGVKFGNGDELGSDDVVTSIQRHQAKDSTSSAAGLVSLIGSMDTPDPLTVVFHLTQAWSDFPFLLSGVAGMVTDQAVIDQLGADQFNKLPVGAGVGPYQPDHFSPGDELVLKRRTDYWGGEVCIGQLRFTRVTGGQATLDAFTNGELDVAFLREPQIIAQEREDKDQEYASLKNMGNAILVNSGVRGSHPPTEDVRLRQAIAAAVDPAALDQRVNEGTGIPHSSIFGEKSRWYQGLEGPKTDPDQAKQLVSQVKAEGKWDGSIRLVCDNSPDRVELGIALEAQLESVGFDVKLDTSGTIGDVINAVIVNADYDLACWGLNTYEEEVWAPINDYVHTGGGGNRSGYSDPNMDAAIDALRAAPDDAARKTALATIQQVWNQTVPQVVLGSVEEVVVWAKGVEGLQFSRDTYVMFGKARLTA